MIISKQMIEDLNIRSSPHPSLPLQILNYSPTTPKKDPIARQCRSLVVDEDYNLVSRSFSRFFNWGEFPEEEKNFDWSDFRVFSKEDGSLINFFYLDGWHMTTKSTFGFGEMPYASVTWRDHVLSVLGLNSFDELSKYLDKNLSYACELVGPYNKVVKNYKVSDVFLLATFSKAEEVDVQKVPYIFAKPTSYGLSSIEEMKDWIERISKTDPEFEGFVAKDKNNQRFKLKSRTYYEIHSLKDNGAIYRDNKLLPHVLDNNRAELELYLPEVLGHYDDLKRRVDQLFAEISSIYPQMIGIESQKDFAIRLREFGIPMSGVYFSARKLGGVNFSLDDLRECFNNSSSLLELL